MLHTCLCEYGDWCILISSTKNIGQYSTALESLVLISENDNCLEAVERSRLLLHETEHETNLGFYRGSREGFSIWQRCLDPFYYQRPIEDRIDIAMGLAWGGNEPSVLRVALAPGPLPSLTHSTTDYWRESLLDAVAWGMTRVKSLELPWASLIDHELGMTPSKPSKNSEIFY